MLNGFDEIALTLLDVYSGLDTIEICTGYTLDGLELEEYPVETRLLQEVHPTYISLPCWKEDISSMKNFEELPENAQNFVQTIEELLGIPIKIVSVGAKRNQTIFR